MKKVSIIIPVYNGATFLEETIACVKAQSYGSIELLIVNDGSTEKKTLQLLDELQSGGITVLHKENGHLASARNYGIKHATGEYILPIDCDDKFAPDFIDKAITILENDEKVGAVSCYVQRFGNDKKLWKPLGGGVQNFLFKNQCSSFGLFRKSDWATVGGYDETMKWGAEDWDFWISVTKAGFYIYIIEEPLFFYRQHATSMLKSVTYQNREKVIRHLVIKHANAYSEGVVNAMSAHKLLDLRYKLPALYYLKLFLKKIFGKELYFE